VQDQCLTIRLKARSFRIVITDAKASETWGVRVKYLPLRYFLNSATIRHSGARPASSVASFERCNTCNSATMVWSKRPLGVAKSLAGFGCRPVPLSKFFSGKFSKTFFLPRFSPNPCRVWVGLLLTGWPQVRILPGEPILSKTYSNIAPAPRGLFLFRATSAILGGPEKIDLADRSPNKHPVVFDADRVAARPLYELPLGPTLTPH